MTSFGKGVDALNRVIDGDSWQKPDKDDRSRYKSLVKEYQSVLQQGALSLSSRFSDVVGCIEVIDSCIVELIVYT